ncbi:MAG: tyrosine-type recombinase/integrase [Clostridiales bacterium]|jgi:site-specific recombinase XerD|nr:tyrosine-type recombinase/integrase [Clostridiales bacterium]
MTYHDELNSQNTLKLRQMLKELPQFAAGYFRSLGDQTASLTRVAYAYDLRIFFTFLSEEVFFIPVREISEEHMAKVQSEQIEEFMEYLSFYVPIENPDNPIQNAALGKSRKLAAVRGIFKYLYKKKYIPANPAELISFPKIKDKVITTLEVDEIAKLLDEVDSGENLTKRQKVFHERTKLRDAAIITLLLGTGMRVSECVGLDLRDIDFEVNGLRVIRKGGGEMILYFGDEVEAALSAYLDVREEIVTVAGHEDALFLSLQNRRITDRAIQNMVKKYASLITQLKNISPHKLRSTFGTQLYAETGDIYLVANVLGHADVNTTRKHYAKMDDTYRRRAANAIRLRD